MRRFLSAGGLAGALLVLGLFASGVFAAPVLVQKVNGNLAGMCHAGAVGSGELLRCHGTFNGVIDGMPAAGGFELCIMDPTGPGPVPGSWSVNSVFDLNAPVPVFDQEALSGALRSLERAKIIKLDERTDLLIFASIFLREDGTQVFNGTVMFGD